MMSTKGSRIEIQSHLAVSGDRVLDSSPRQCGVAGGVGKFTFEELCGFSLRHPSLVNVEGNRPM